jgi:hypothetical protein
MIVACIAVAVIITVSTWTSAVRQVPCVRSVRPKD